MCVYRQQRIEVEFFFIFLASSVVRLRVGVLLTSQLASYSSFQRYEVHIRFPIPCQQDSPKLMITKEPNKIRGTNLCLPSLYTRQNIFQNLLMDRRYYLLHVYHILLYSNDILMKKTVQTLNKS